ncbi:hypothetical protein OHA72_27365 [Dactylosporangium sp. NBC_01737]|uniref:hypothetical protein n=1 Tax=Dactylosporangium sp. NBC_01737 TaxID=2975959 RepID=UPI002E0FCCA8|nr:hypothetical protein OHA72_27365 [Dactylosporangium sp. NBC_01737]
MNEFIGAAFAFPTAMFSVLLVAVVGYWVVVVVGALDVGSLDASGESGGDGGGMLSVAGLGGVPITVTISFLTAIGWFASLAAGALVHGAFAPAVVLIVALGVAWLVTRLAVLALRRLFTPAQAPSRADFLGRSCVIRTGTVTLTFGQAEVTVEDGSSAIVQVRQAGDGGLRAGSAAYIYGYDDPGEFFWVVEDPLTLA